MLVFSFFGFLYRICPGNSLHLYFKNSHLIDGSPKAEASVLYLGISALGKSTNCFVIN